MREPLWFLIVTETTSFRQTMAPNESTRLVHSDESATTSTLWVCFGFVFVHAILMGMNLGLPNPIIASVQDTFKLDSWQLGWLVAIGPFATALSSLVGGVFADSLGRWALSGCAIIICLVGGVVMALSQGYAQLLIGRGLHGFHVGLSMVVIALYTAESSPRHLRGRFGTGTEVSINIGILGVVAGALVLTQWFGFTHDQDWRCLTWISVGLASCLLPAWWFLPETPRWYAMQNRWGEAETTLRNLVSDPEEVEAVIAQLRDGAQASLSQNRSCCTQLGALLCCDPQVRLPLVRAQGMAFFHHFTGIIVPSLYSTLLLQDAYGKTQAQIGAVIIFAFKLVAILVATFLVDMAGRRPLLLASCLVMGSGYFLWAAADGFTWTAVALVVCAVGFSIGLGPLNYVIPGEVLPLSIRAWGVAACNITCRVTEAGVSLATLPAMEAFGFLPCVLVLGGNCLIAMAFFWFVMPENKQLTIEKSSSQA